VAYIVLFKKKFWSNHGIVCLIISVLGSTKTQNILHEKRSFWIGL
jgi:hypothetical protein